MGLAAKPNLPPINPKYDTALKGNAAQPQSQSQTQSQSQIEPEPTVADVSEAAQIPEQKDTFSDLLAQRENAKLKALQIPIIRQELAPKITADIENAQLYVAMIEQQSDEAMNPRQSEVLNTLAKAIRTAQNPKQKSAVVSEDSLNVLDELLLMCDAPQLFPAVSLLRLLLTLPSVANRYSSDFMILQQVLYKIGIEFESLLPQQNDEKEDVDVDEDAMSSTDLHQLQFTAIAAVGHLYLGRCEGVEIDEGFVNLGLNALRSADANVRLAAVRLLFNVLREAKKQAMCAKESEAEGVCKRIYEVLRARWGNETHVPTRFRMLCCFVMGCFAEDVKTMEARGCGKDVVMGMAKGKSDGNAQVDTLKAEIVSVLEAM